MKYSEKIESLLGKETQDQITDDLSDDEECLDDCRDNNITPEWYVYDSVAGQGSIILENLLKIQCYPGHGAYETWRDIIESCKRTVVCQLRELRNRSELFDLEILTDLLYHGNLQECGLYFMKHWGKQQAMIDLGQIEKEMEVIAKDCVSAFRK